MHLAVLTLFQQVPLLIRVDGLILVLIGIKLKKSISVKRGIKNASLVKHSDKEPLILMVARAESPAGVARATMVSDIGYLT